MKNGRNLLMTDDGQGTTAPFTSVNCAGLILYGVCRISNPACTLSREKGGFTFFETACTARLRNATCDMRHYMQSYERI